MEEQAQSRQMEHKKRKGGAEKLRDRKKSLQELAATSRKITDLFGGISGPPTGPIPSTSSSSGELQQRQLDFTKPESSSSKDDEPDADTAEHGAEPSQGTTSDMMMVSYV